MGIALIYQAFSVMDGVLGQTGRRAILAEGVLEPVELVAGGLTHIGQHRRIRHVQGFSAAASCPDGSVAQPARQS